MIFSNALNICYGKENADILKRTAHSHATNEISVDFQRIARRGRATDGKVFDLAEEGPSSNGQDGPGNPAGRESGQGPRNDTDSVNRMIC